jgi:hypothetical protein
LFRVKLPSPCYTACAESGAMSASDGPERPAAIAGAASTTVSLTLSDVATVCSFKEQQAVEDCFLAKGTLLPTFHKFYWMGLRSGVASSGTASLMTASQA